MSGCPPTPPWAVSSGEVRPRERVSEKLVVLAGHSGWESVYVCCWGDGAQRALLAFLPGLLAARVAFTLVKDTKSSSSWDSEGGTANRVWEEL